MSQLVFLHGPGAGACADAYPPPARAFPEERRADLARPPRGRRCPDVERYTEWVRGWLWAQGLKTDLVLVGYTLGASIALQYGLDYPDEVKGLVVMTVAARPKTRAAGTYEMRLRAAEDPKVYEEWLAYQRHAMKLVEPGLARAADRAAPPGGATVPVPRPESDRRLRRPRSARDAQAQAARPSWPGRSHQSAGIREGDPRRRARFTVRETVRRGTLPTHRDSGQDQRADRGVPGLCHFCQRGANCVATTWSYLTSPSSRPISRANRLMCATICSVMVGS